MANQKEASPYREEYTLNGPNGEYLLVVEERDGKLAIQESDSVIELPMSSEKLGLYCTVIENYLNSNVQIAKAA